MRTVPVMLIVALLGAILVAVPASAGAASCRFTLGFKALHDLIPATVGTCLRDVQYGANGDGLQKTTGGLLVWRKADNWTAFTDGYHTWINGPNGLQERLNTTRFPWEADAAGKPIATGVGVGSNRRMTVYQVTNASSRAITVVQRFHDASGFQYTLVSQLAPRATETIHVRDLTAIPSPFDGSVSMSATGPITARVIGYDQP